MCFFTGSPTTGAQINLASLRNNSLTNQDVPLDSHGDSRLRNSCMSLDEKTRTMSRSGSFRDGFEEGEKGSLLWKCCIEFNTFILFNTFQ